MTGTKPLQVQRPYGQDGRIERGIRPLVDALNAVEGVSTIASCEGHVTGFLPPRTYRSPYVLFVGPFSQAALIAKAFLLDGVRQFGGHGAGWSVTASLSPMLRWQWVLRGDGIAPREYRRACMSASTLVKKLTEGLKCAPEEPGLDKLQPERCCEGKRYAK